MCLTNPHVSLVQPKPWEPKSAGKEDMTLYYQKITKTLSLDSGHILVTSREFCHILFFCCISAYPQVKPCHLCLTMSPLRDDILCHHATSLWPCHFCVSMPPQWGHAISVWPCHFYVSMPPLCGHATSVGPCHLCLAMPLLCRHVTSVRDSVISVWPCHLCSLW